jgi:hypothetical protein
MPAFFAMPAFQYVTPLQPHCGESSVGSAVPFFTQTPDVQLDASQYESSGQLPRPSAVHWHACAPPPSGHVKAQLQGSGRVQPCGTGEPHATHPSVGVPLEDVTPDDDVLPLVPDEETVPLVVPAPLLVVPPLVVAGPTSPRTSGDSAPLHATTAARPSPTMPRAKPTRRTG